MLAGPQPSSERPCSSCPATTAGVSDGGQGGSGRNFISFGKCHHDFGQRSQLRKPVRETNSWIGRSNPESPDNVAPMLKELAHAHMADMQFRLGGSMWLVRFLSPGQASIPGWVLLAALGVGLCCCTSLDDPYYSITALKHSGPSVVHGWNAFQDISRMDHSSILGSR